MGIVSGVVRQRSMSRRTFRKTIIGMAIVGLLPFAVLSLNFTTEGGLDPRITASGGVNGTRVNSAGTIVAATAPRYDYDPVTLAPKGIIIENGRTNMFVRSGDLSNVAWQQINAVCTGAQKIAPDGTNTGASLISNNTATLGRVSQTAAYTAGVTYAVSVWIAPNGKTSWQILLPAALWADATARVSTFTLTGNGAVSGSSGGGAVGTITAWPNGWYRCCLTATPDTSVSAAAQIRDPTIGDGVNGVFIWGAQSEAGPLTSYIPTVAATVARTIDAFSMPWTFGNTGTFLVNAIPGAAAGNGSDRYLFNISDGTANNSIKMLFRNAGGLGITWVSGGVTQFDSTPQAAYVVNTLYKAATAGATNYGSSVVNGGASSTTGVLTLPAGLTTLTIGADITGTTSTLTGWLQSLKYMVPVEPDTQLQRMTT